MKLDDRIKKDLGELYDSDLFKYIQLFKDCKITEAEQLSQDLFDEPDCFSTHGLPGYYTGDREAKTVMVMLNPGSDVLSRNNPFATEEALKKLNMRTDSIDLFVDTFKEGSANFGEKDADRVDNFDVKQAAFLKDWPEDCGVVIPEDFPDKVSSLAGKENEKKRNKLLQNVKQNVLMQKLQLELIPYASREFKSIGNERIKHLFPYVETLFDEIFRCEERKYVIFCSDFFYRLFELYSKSEYPGTIDIDDKQSRKVFNNGKNSYCTSIRINYGGKSMKAIIAHTFPNKTLPNAYEIMREYGAFCYDVWKNSRFK